MSDGNKNKRFELSEIDPMVVLDSLPDGITIQDWDFSIVYQNKAMLSAFGNQIGMKCYSAYEKRDSICEGCGVAKAFRSGQSIMVLRTAFDAHGGTSYWENYCFPIKDKSGGIIAGAEVCRNISDRVSLEAEVKKRNIELGQLNKQLKRQTEKLAETFKQLEEEMHQRERAEAELYQSQKLQAIGQLAAGISHEINTPTQYVSDNIHFLSEGFDALRQLLNTYRQVLNELASAPSLEAVSQRIKQAEEIADADFLEENVPPAFCSAKEGIARIASIVHAMKKFAHGDNTDMDLEDINTALHTTLVIANNELKHVAEVTKEFEKLPLVRCHLGEINQVVLNLLVNAAHAISDVVGQSGDKGRIIIRTRNLGDWVQIEIADTGQGIPENIRDKIFVPFFTTKEVGRGSGQGLSISYAIVVNKHGGTLTFQTEMGKGTTFIVKLPVAGKDSQKILTNDHGKSK